jgi:hypothetical protein
MLVRDLRVDGKGIFYYMNELEELPFIPVMEIETMDKLFIGLHGMKNISPATASIMSDGGVTESNMSTLARMVLLKYGDAWNKLYKLYTQDMPLETYSMTTTERHEGSEATSSSTSTETTSEDLDRVSGYNSESMVDDSVKNIERTDLTENEGTRSDERTITKEVKGLQNSRVLEAERLIRFIKRHLIIDEVFHNVADVIGSLFYKIY